MATKKIATIKLRAVFAAYWIMLLYIVAALVWWFIALNKQNIEMAAWQTSQLKKDEPSYLQQLSQIENRRHRKTAQYIGEGAVFFLLIVAGAVFIFRAVKRELKTNRQQQHLMMAITHELKTPIAVARLNLETLQKRKLDENHQHRLIQNTLQEANRLNDLCSNLLFASQLEGESYVFNPEPTDVSAIAAQAVQEYSSRFPQRQYSSNIAPALSVKGDAMLLQMAINNLLDNATKYSPKQCPIALAALQEQQTVLLTVTDTGKGIALEDREKIFTKFYRAGNAATKAAKGTGLGLYLTRRIVQQHGGAVWVSNNMPTGSIFSIQLPLWKG
jgi:two-component system, OmpR family, sensor histidine kinase CiaH